MSRQRAMGLLLLGVVVLGPGGGRAAEETDSLLPPVVRPVRKISLHTDVQEPYMRSRYGVGSSAVFSADGKYLAALNPQRGQLSLWDSATGKSVRGLGWTREMMALAFSPDGKMLVTTDADHSNPSVRLWDVETGKELRQLDEGVNTTHFLALAFSPDGKTLALGGINQRQGSQSLCLWDVASGDEIRQLESPAAPGVQGRRQRPITVESLCFSPDGRSLALAVDNRIMLWEVSSGKQRSLLGTLPARPEEPQHYEMMYSPVCLAFSPDGRLLAAGCPDETVRLWDVLTGRELTPLTGHRGPVRTICFAPDGKTLKSLAWDGKLLVWPLTGAFRTWQPRGDKLSAEQLAGLWSYLESDDPWLVHAVVANLAAVPTQSMPLLRERLKPAPQGDSQRITQLITELDNADYNTRKRAAAELHKLGERALPALRHALEMGNAEGARGLLSRMEGVRSSEGMSQALAAVAVLERIGTAEAQELLALLAKGAAESPLTLRVKAAQERLEKPAVGVVKLEGLWEDLGSDDARRAFHAIQALGARHKEAVPLLRDRIKALPALKAPDDDPRRLARLIQELDNDDFAVREKAAGELKRLGARAEKTLRKRLKEPASPEITRRIEELLKEAAQPTLSREVSQVERGLETLERLGTPEARLALEALLKETTNRQVAEQINGALRRLGEAH